MSGEEIKQRVRIQGSEVHSFSQGSQVASWKPSEGGTTPGTEAHRVYNKVTCLEQSGQGVPPTSDSGGPAREGPVGLSKDTHCKV